MRSIIFVLLASMGIMSCKSQPNPLYDSSNDSVKIHQDHGRVVINWKLSTQYKMTSVYKSEDCTNWYPILYIQTNQHSVIDYPANFGVVFYLIHLDDPDCYMALHYVFIPRKANHSAHDDIYNYTTYPLCK